MRASPDPSAVRDALRRATASLVAAAALFVALAVPSVASATTISAGLTHTCAVKTGGAVVCWGLNEDGQLGNGTDDNAHSPVAVTGITDAVEVSAGSVHTCALRAGGSVSCWGRGSAGTLGDGKRVSSTTPVSVSGLTNAVALSTGGYTTCALTSAGEIFCWGQHFGPASGGMPGWADAPVRLGDVTGAKDVSVSDGEVCAVFATDTDCWGFMVDRGDGAMTAASAPIALPASDAIQMTSGTSWYGCALLATGQVSCRGHNDHGELGNGTTGTTTPRGQMPRGQSLAFGLTNARAVVALQSSSCALLAGGTVSCWGGIGNGLTEAGGAASGIVATPATVTGLDATTGITAGFGHVCAVDGTGAARCWGGNYWGQLGNGTGIPSNCPTLVPGLQVATSARDAVTPIRRDEPDQTVPDPEQTTATTPPPPAQTSLPCLVLGPQRVLPLPTSPTPPPLTPQISAGVAAALRAVPQATLSGGAVRLVGFRVPERWLGRCPKTAKVVVRAAGRTSKRKTFRVKRTEAGTCEITGVVRLRGRLAKASRVVIVVRPPGVRGFTRTVSA